MSRRLSLLAATLLMVSASVGYGQAVIVPSPIPALTNNCVLKWQTATSTWVCASAAATSQPLTDSLGLIADDANPTKILAFQLAGLSASTTRTWTIPDANITVPSTIASLGANTFTGLQALNGGLSATTGAFSSTLGVGGVLSVSGFGSHSFSAGGAGVNAIVLRNTAAGTGAAVELDLGNDLLAYAGAVNVFSSTYTPSGAAFADGMRIAAFGTGGLSLSANNAAGVIRFFTGASLERMRISAAGFVGIGTASPDAKLTIQSAASSYAITTNDGVVTTGIFNGTTGGLTAGYIGTASAHPLAFFAGGSSALMTLSPNGSLVVGAATGGAKGAGTINAQAVYDDNVLLTDWVFDLASAAQDVPAQPAGPAKGREKRLFTLAETKATTLAEKRLPWMPTPSEFEVERHTGGMITRLWQGQEQQQLYLFDLDARLKALEAQKVGK